MVGFTRELAVAVAVLSFFSETIAAPPPEVDFVNLIETAKGLPTVQELNLTNADLARPNPELMRLFSRAVRETLSSNDPHVARATLEKRYEPRCSTGPSCTVTDARACLNYFVNTISGKKCQITVQKRVQMCRMGTCAWDAVLRDGVTHAQTFCINVGEGGNWVLKNCEKNGRVAGRVTPIRTIFFLILQDNIFTLEIEADEEPCKSGSNAALGNGDLIVDIVGRP
ncbi:hypothetical protein TWF718_009649 [Orbilia javanica]|uniref:Secreted protein n=1 Tax=Orbilia javanica TaxID=47235 RepID=A0AAN8MMV6_9PEZI